jgi:hypothetical protein
MPWTALTDTLSHTAAGLALLVWQPFRAWSTTAKGLLLLGSLCGALLSGGFAVGLWTADRVGWGARITELEEWREVHEEVVVAPEVRRIRNLEAQMTEVRAWIAGPGEVQAEMVRQLYCGAFPERCQPVPREE